MRFIGLYCYKFCCNFFNLIVIPLGEWIWDTKVPVGAVWKLLPWNKGRSATCNIKVVYADSDFRIMADNDMELFVYANSQDQALLVARLDNLGKGASGAAVQNLNLMLGLGG